MSQVSRQSRRMLLAVAAALIWLSVGATFFQTIHLAAKAPMTVVLTSQPQAVKVKANRQVLFAGEYQQTPFKINLPPGQHNLQISREGFITHEITVHGYSGQEIPIDHVLEKRPEAELGTLYVEHRHSDAPFYVEMAGGLIKGMTPISVDSLVVGQDYDLSVYPAWPKKKNAGRCRLQVRPSPQDTDVELRRLKSGRVRFSGCRPLRRVKR